MQKILREDNIKALVRDCDDEENCIIVVVSERLTDWEMVGAVHLDTNALYDIAVYKQHEEEPEDATW